MADITKAVIDTLIAEAGGEGEIGLIAAAWAMQQRVAARGQTLDQVVRSGFDGFTNPGPGSRKAQQSPAMRSQAERILTGVSNGSIPNPVPGADHFLSGNVMPGWANKMQLVATIGGHRYYASGNVPRSAYGTPMPPGELPQVGTALDVNPPVRAVPVTASPDLQALRNAPRLADVPSPQARPQTAMDILRTATMGTPDMGPISAMYAPQVAERGPMTTRDLFFDSGIADTIAGAQALQQGQGGLAAALEQMLRPQAAPQRAPRQATAAEVAAAGAGTPWGAADGPAARLASAPKLSTTPKKPTAQEMAAIYRDGGPTRPATTQGQAVTDADLIWGPGIRDTVERTAAMQPAGLAAALEQYVRPPTKTPTPMPTNVAQSYAGQEGTRSTSTNTGKPPTTRTVQSVPVKGSPTPASMSDALAVSRAPGETVVTIPTTQPKTDVQRAAEIYWQGGPSQGMPKGKTTQETRIAAAQTTGGMPWSNKDGPAVSGARLAAAPKTVAATPQRSVSEMAALYAGGGPTRPNASPTKADPLKDAPVYGPNNHTPKTDDRLLPEQTSIVRTATRGIPASAPIMVVGEEPVLAEVDPPKLPPVPMPYGARPQGVGTQLDVALQAAPRRGAGGQSQRMALTGSLSKAPKRIGLGDMVGNFIRNAPLDRQKPHRSAGSRFNANRGYQGGDGDIAAHRAAIEPGIASSGGRAIARSTPYGIGCGYRRPAPTKSPSWRHGVITPHHQEGW